MADWNFIQFDSNGSDVDASGDKGDLAERKAGLVQIVGNAGEQHAAAHAMGHQVNALKRTAFESAQKISESLARGFGAGFVG